MSARRFVRWVRDGKSVCFTVRFGYKYIAVKTPKGHSIYEEATE